MITCFCVRDADFYPHSEPVLSRSKTDLTQTDLNDILELVVWKECCLYTLIGCQNIRIFPTPAVLERSVAQLLACD